MQTPCAGLLIIVSLFGNCLAFIVSATESLTIEQTLEMSKGGWLDFPSRDQVLFCLRVANPGAREGLYRILGDPKQSCYWAGSVSYLAYITGPEDVGRLREFIFCQKGMLSEERYRAIHSVFLVLSVMAVRGIGEARHEVWKMVRPAYWREVAFALPKSWRGEPGPLPIELAGGALVAYADMDGPDAERLIKAFADAAVPEEERSWLALFVKRATKVLAQARETVQETMLRKANEQREGERRGGKAIVPFIAAIWSGTPEEVFLAAVGAGLVLWFVLRVVCARRGNASQAGRSGPAPPLDAGDKKR